MVKTVIFDLGKVIVPFDFKRGYERMAPLGAYSALEIPERLRAYDLVSRFESGAVDPQDFVRELSEILELKCDYDQFCDIWSSIFLPDPLIPDSLLEGLHKRYRLVLLSNTNDIHFTMVEKNYPILRHFDQFILSHKVGAMKPSPKIFAAAVEAAQCRPEECFFTDDIAEYVQGARDYGIDAVQFQNAEQIQRELKSRGVEW